MSPSKNDKKAEKKGGELSVKQKLISELIGAQKNQNVKDKPEYDHAVRIKEALIDEACKENEEDKKNEDEEEDTSKHQDYPPDEDKFVLEILKKFLIGTESSFLDSINIILMLKALPVKIVDYNIEQMLKFDFSTL